MKKILAIFIGLIVSLMVSGQTVKLNKDQQVSSFAGSVSDIVDATGESVVLKFDITKKSSLQLYAIQVYLDSIAYTATSTTPEVSTYLSYSYDDVTYTNLDTVAFSVSASDTTFAFTDASTGTMAGFLKVTISGIDSTSVKFNKAFGRFVDK